MNNVNKLYENIRKRRNLLNMSQQELADAVGYKNKSMISHVEKGIIDLPVTMIKKFAEALKTTPSYLLGWEDENGNEIIKVELEMPNDELHKRALMMYENYLNANPAIQTAIDALLKLRQQDS